MTQVWPGAAVGAHGVARLEVPLGLPLPAACPPQLHQERVLLKAVTGAQAGKL